MLRAIIIEDEAYSRELLHQLIVDYCEEVEIVGTAEDVYAGIQAVKELKPDLVFLDIEMPGGDGFEILKVFDPIPFKVIFVTGYEQYAIRAIRYSALDYLLKPVNIQELQLAVKKAREQQQLQQLTVQSLKWNMQAKNRDWGRLVIHTDQEHFLINISDIIYLKAQGSYVFFHLENDQKRLASHPLSYYEDILPTEQFFRVHHSYIVNCKKVVSVSGGRGGDILLNGEVSIPIAFRRKSTFIKLLEEKS